MSSVEVSALRVYWQRSGVFEQHLDPLVSCQSWRGHIHTLLQCHVKPGDGEFLFTGSEHFGEAWLGCAPRYKDFLSVYHNARTARQNSCDFPLDWGGVCVCVRTSHLSNTELRSLTTSALVHFRSLLSHSTKVAPAGKSRWNAGDKN